MSKKDLACLNSCSPFVGDKVQTKIFSSDSVGFRFFPLVPTIKVQISLKYDMKKV